MFTNTFQSFVNRVVGPRWKDRRSMATFFYNVNTQNSVGTYPASCGHVNVGGAFISEAHDLVLENERMISYIRIIWNP